MSRVINESRGWKLSSTLLSILVAVIGCIAFPLISPIVGIAMILFWFRNRKSEKQSTRLVTSIALIVGAFAFVIFALMVTGYYVGGESIVSTGPVTEVVL